MNKTGTILLIGIMAILGGCVERTLNITTNPPGAIVTISNKQIGRTPIEDHTFTWYGDYEIIIRLEGYKTLKTSAKIDPPWYEYPPADLFSELAPWTYRDQRYLHFDLEKYVPSSKESLIDRAVKTKKDAENDEKDP